MPAVTEPPKLIPYYCLSHSTWSLSNNIEVTCRLFRVKPGKSLTNDRTFVHQNSLEDESGDITRLLQRVPSKVYYKPSLLHKGK